MKKTILFLSVLAMTLGFVACSNDDDFVEQTEIIQPQTKKMTISANLDDNLTRTALGTGNSVVWSAGDKITLTKMGASLDAPPIVFTIKEGMGTTTATFEGEQLENGTYKAFYGDLLVSASQSYDTEKKIADVPMYAKVNVSNGTAENVTFENLCGLLKLTLKSSLPEAVVHSITIETNTSVAGQLQVTSYANNQTLTPELFNPYKKGDLRNISIASGTGSNSLVYSCGEGVKLSSTGTDLYMILPVTRSDRTDNVTSYTKFDIKILFENGYALTKTLNNNATLKVARSKITPVTLTIDKFGDAQSHTYVDLGLPSGTRWATTNIGASTETDAGNYYAWGEIAPKANYSWGTYEWGTSTNLSKYTSNSEDGTIVLSPVDDAAVVNWGSGWRMPTVADWTELIEKCTWTLNTSSYYYTVKGPNNNTIKLPCAGFYQNTTQTYGGSSSTTRTSNLYYWSNSLYKAITKDKDGNVKSIDCQYGQNFFTQNANTLKMNYISRSYGLPIRPVRDNKKE